MNRKLKRTAFFGNQNHFTDQFNASLLKIIMNFSCRCKIAVQKHYSNWKLCCCLLSIYKMQLSNGIVHHYVSVVSPIGVADGVGGWRDYGVDPSQFSGTLMRTCERLVKEGRFVPSNPVGILTTSYYELLQNKVPLLGEHIQL